MANKPENLKPFKKGDDCRRHKKSKGEIHLKTKLINALNEVWKDGEKKETALVLIDVILKKAIKEGNEAMIRLIWEYLEQKPVQGLDVKSGGRIITGFNFIKNGDTADNKTIAETGSGLGETS